MLLTIGIPTYNRASFLRENLETFLPQLKNYLNDIEIIISDNASEDETEGVVKEASAIFSVPITYKKQEKNIGPELNAVWIVDNSKGEYLYLMGDDDILSPNFADIIIPILKRKEKAVAVHWNRLTGNAECTNNVLVDKSYMGKTEEILNPKDFIKRVMDNPNFISSIIFKKEVLEIGKPYYKEDYFGYSFFAQMYFGILLSQGNCIYYYFPLVIQRNPSKTWAKYWPQFFISSLSNLFFDFEEYIPGIYEKWKKTLRKGVPKCIAFVGCEPNYYRKKNVRKLMVRHLTLSEKIKYYFYLIPGIFQIRQFLVNIIRTLR